jgi:hypothetical protein
MRLLMSQSSLSTPQHTSPAHAHTRSHARLTHAAYMHARTLPLPPIHQAACAKLEHEQLPADHSGFRLSRRPAFGRTLCLLALQKPGQGSTFTVCRPNTGVGGVGKEGWGGW